MFDRNISEDLGKPMKESERRYMGRVKNIKGSYGFIVCFELGKGKDTFFHLSNKKFKSEMIREGDLVGFSIGKDEKTGKSKAIDVSLVKPSEKDEDE